MAVSMTRMKPLIEVELLVREPIKLEKGPSKKLIEPKSPRKKNLRTLIQSALSRR
jgi:hypothetical protein